MGISSTGQYDDETARMCGTDDEHRSIQSSRHHPLEIVDDQRSAAITGADGSAYSIEQPMALSHVARLFRSGRSGNVSEFGQETSELCPPDRIERVDMAPDSIRS